MYGVRRSIFCKSATPSLKVTVKMCQTIVLALMLYLLYMINAATTMMYVRSACNSLTFFSKLVMINKSALERSFLPFAAYLDGFKVYYGVLDAVMRRPRAWL